MTGISNKFVRFFFTNSEVNFLHSGFVRVSQRIFWKNFCFRSFVRHHGWLSRTNFDNLRYWSKSFLIGKFLAVNFLTVGAVDADLDGPLTLNTWSRNLTGVLWQFIRILLFNIEGDFLYASFIGISQLVLWQSVCFWCITRYHIWLSCADFDNLCYWSQGFLIRQFLAVDFLAVGAVDAGLDGPLALNTWSRDLTGVLWQFICVLFFNIEGDFLNTRFVRISQQIFWQGVCFRRIIWYHGWLSSTNFNNLRYWG